MYGWLVILWICLKLPAIYGYQSRTVLFWLLCMHSLLSGIISIMIIVPFFADVKCKTKYSVGICCVCCVFSFFLKIIAAVLHCELMFDVQFKPRVLVHLS